MNGQVLAPVSVSALPSPSAANANLIQLVSNSANCTTSSGTAPLLCISTGSAWVPLGGAPGSGMVYPAAGIANSTGSSWGAPYQVGSGANQIPQFDANGNLILSATLPPSAPGNSVAVGGVVRASNIAPSLKDFGAKGNGSADDTAAFTAALAAGASVYVPCGTYLIAANTAIGSPVTIIGASPDCAILQLKSAASGPVLNVTSSNVTFWGVTLNAAGGSGNGINVASGVSNIKFLNSVVENAGAVGVLIAGASNVLVAESRFFGSAQTQFQYALPSSGTVSAGHLRFQNNTFDGTLATGPAAMVSLYLNNNNSTGTLQDISITGNSILYPNLGSSETDGIVLSTGGVAGAVIANVVISGNTIGASTPGSTSGQAVELWNTTNVTVSGNAILNPYNGIQVTGSGPSAALSGNFIRTPSGGSSAITCGGTCSSTGDMVTGSFTQGVGLNGTGNLADGDTIQLTGNGDCIDLVGADTQALNNVVGSNGGTGIKINTSPANNMSIRNNHVTTGSTGIYPQNGGTFNNVVIANNTIDSAVGNPYSSHPTSYSGLTVVTDPGAAANLPNFSIDSACAAALAGGSNQWAGKYTSGTAGTCTVTFTTSTTAPHGWACDAHNLTAAASLQSQTAASLSSPTAPVISGPTAAGDVISYRCWPW